MEIEENESYFIEYEFEVKRRVNQDLALEGGKTLNLGDLEDETPGWFNFIVIEYEI